MSVPAPVSASDRPKLLGLDRAGLEALFVSWGEPRFRAAQVLQWLHARQVSDFAQMSNVSKTLRARLEESCETGELEVLREQLAADGTRKWLLGLSDGNAIETVFIPEEERGTLCISSQVGCSLACSFCATGAQGLSRNLETHEIIAQIRVARRVLGLDAISNVVFMGMGEPLLNLKQVLPAIRLLLDDYGYGLSSRRVTVSTAGVLPGLAQLGRESPVNLAISLHATRDDIRDELVPINRHYPLAELLLACRAYPLPPRRRITFEYVMLEGVNDQDQHARELVRLLAGIPALVNLIPFNPFPESRYRRSSPARIDAFREIILRAGLMTVTRKTRGDDIAAACGQLAGQVQRGRRSIPLQVLN
ncbi:23S rRNA (adenine(2503)-C(2))-methyltransferase RlmN [Acidithiobacillus sp. CV18-2]|uniref:Dual-specificity RNA methyltransferase RlmN n=1 Tax=Igneacidithiobacillus copahuensis TaxID=2724909 RepID=A0AAE3CK79_9PROT|nr:23S rRNA (adenine(2503)-C(2))-methyltransferase RlmN [Igneacidithiobacillus copahuensis]MBU2753519.1 23S rRNA (adenine(2503)-C(2))-methyltransferase RlmN [Acidithiobacillus sp. CV18-3]MBU2757137.1 23S rRNA (adenine(2503)-C(2))-methyltransferase RlmN [Acidithiobacillus sp. BN09-2]MBU2776013.1 23S rRNA (adenine(2503)-C(2))-methyltransferase RlmN [Acidithiobacillus sp. CV18-2]MBU2795904.1 23S rRNA (adenine(2503)-C(2))-methyltransferase RlmN [Acidithiobacillus sp. VAN18-2]MBU2800310.1 23S rRNA 